MQLTLWSLPSIAALLAVGLTFVRVRSLGAVPGARAFLGVIVCAGFWSAGQLIGTLSTELDVKRLAATIQYPGITLLPVAWLLFAVTLTRRRTVSPVTVAVFSLFPILTFVLALTNGLHGLIWSDLSLVEAPGGFVGFTLTYGPWFSAQLIYGYVLVVAGTAILVFELSASPLHRRTMHAVAAACGVVAACNLVYLSPINPWPWFDPTVLGIAIAGAVLNRGVLQVRYLETNPILRREVVEQLSDAVVIVGGDGAILDLNPAAASLLGIGLERALRTNLATCLATPLLPKLLDGVGGEVSVDDRFYDAKSTVLRSDGDRIVELAIVFRDVTDQLRMRERLERSKIELEQAANTDPLTQLSNRRYFRQRLEAEIGNVERHAVPLSVVLFDLDHFKRVNDSFGHDVGDRVLQVIGHIALEFKRGADVAARLGGEEFALLLPNTDLAGAVRVAQRLRQTVEEHVISDRNHNPIRVTVSIGVAAVNVERPNSDRTLTDADRALYRAKRAGRNCVCTTD